MFNAIKEYFVNNAKSEHIAESLNSQQNATLFLDIEDVYNGITFEEYNTKYGFNYSSLSQEIFTNFHRIVFEGESNYQEVLDNARTYENDFIALHSAEVNMRYMGVFSILRHSFKYWVEAYENESHPWNKLAKSKDLSTTRGPGWWARIAVDIAVYNDCLENGGLGAQNLGDAQSNCLPSASYASSRAYEDGIGPLKGDDIIDSK